MPELIELSHRIYENPELNFEEVKAAGWCTDWLEQAGFKVERGIADLPTAFRATYGSGPLRVGIEAEYDALPDVGHACGHNIIATAALGAAVGLAAVADDAGVTVVVLGTPAEEGGGGKIFMVEKGVFDDVDCALMIHPGPMDTLAPEALAAQSMDITYTGVPSHAGGAPELGVNAADALVIAQVAMGLLRQHLLESDRVHGIVTRGGEAVNIIPALATAQWMIRATTAARLDELRAKVLRCFEAGALATGAKLEVKEYPVYADIRHDRDLVALYEKNAEALGRRFDTPSTFSRFSTDQGNVSYVTPSIHPMLSINCLPAVNHQPEFAAATITADGDKTILDGALSMAWTAIDAATNEGVRARLLTSTD